MCTMQQYRDKEIPLHASVLSYYTFTYFMRSINFLSCKALHPVVTSHMNVRYQHQKKKMPLPLYSDTASPRLPSPPAASLLPDLSHTFCSLSTAGDHLRYVCRTISTNFRMRTCVGMIFTDAIAKSGRSNAGTRLSTRGRIRRRGLTLAEATRRKLTSSRLFSTM